MIIKEFHGKHYYTVLKTYQECIEIQRFISEEESLKDEFWTLKRLNDNEWVIFSDAKVEKFRGEKYHAWETVKQKLYKSRRN